MGIIEISPCDIKGIRRALMNIFTSRIRLTLPNRPIIENVNDAEAWCLEQLGPSAWEWKKDGAIVHSDRAWARYGWTYFFKDDTTATAFALVWD